MLSLQIRCNNSNITFCILSERLFKQERVRFRFVCDKNALNVLYFLTVLIGYDRFVVRLWKKKTCAQYKRLGGGLRRYVASAIFRDVLWTRGTADRRAFSKHVQILVRVVRFLFVSTYCDYGFDLKHIRRVFGPENEGLSGRGLGSQITRTRQFTTSLSRFPG